MEVTVTNKKNVYIVNKYNKTYTFFICNFFYCQYITSYIHTYRFGK